MPSYKYIICSKLQDIFTPDSVELKMMDLNHHHHHQERPLHSLYHCFLCLLHHFVTLQNFLLQDSTPAASLVAHHHQILTMPAFVELWLLKVQPRT